MLSPSPRTSTRHARRLATRRIGIGVPIALAVGLVLAAPPLAGPALAQDRDQAAETAGARPVDPATIGIRLDAGEGPDRVERWQRRRGRAEAAYWAALPEEAPIVGLRPEREEGRP
jgi:hypothetical protein